MLPTTCWRRNVRGDRSRCACWNACRPRTTCRPSCIVWAARAVRRLGARQAGRRPVAVPLRLCPQPCWTRRTPCVPGQWPARPVAAYALPKDSREDCDGKDKGKRRNEERAEARRQAVRVRRAGHRRGVLRPLPAALPARPARPFGEGAGGRRGGRRHLVLEPLSRRALRFRKPLLLLLPSPKS